MRTEVKFNKEKVIQTTNATPTVISNSLSIVIPSGTMMRVKYNVMAVRADGAVRAWWYDMIGTWSNGILPVLVGSIVNIVPAQKDTLATTWLATAKAGTDSDGRAVLYLELTGQLATVINWWCVMREVHLFTP